jgi:hypothetical protein
VAGFKPLVEADRVNFEREKLQRGKRVVHQ